MSLNLGRGALPGVVGGDVLQKFGRWFVPVKQSWSFLDDESNGLSVQTVVNLEQEGSIYHNLLVSHLSKSVFDLSYSFFGGPLFKKAWS